MADEFRKILLEKMKALMPAQVLVAEVTAVDEQQLSCDVKLIDDETELFDIRLLPAIGESAASIVLIPETGSLVLVGIIANIPSASYMITCQKASKIILRGGSLGGLVKAKELKKQIDKNTNVLQAIINVLTGAPIPEPGNQVPSALQTALKSAVTGKQLADLKDIENKTVTHG